MSRETEKERDRHWESKIESEGGRDISQVRSEGKTETLDACEDKKGGARGRE